MRGGMVVLAAMGLGLLGGCARDATAPDSVSVEGIYHLASVNGAPLPFLIQRDSTVRVDVTESVMTLNHDSTWSEVTRYRVNSSGNTTTPSQMAYGTYSRVNDALELTSADGFREHGAISTGRLTFLDGGFSLVYRR